MLLAANSRRHGPIELKEHRFTWKNIWTTWTRPFVMFFTEPIVLFLSLLSGFSDALIFTRSLILQFSSSGDLVLFRLALPSYRKSNLIAFPLNAYKIRGLLVGYIIAYLSFFPFIHRHRQIRQREPDTLQPE